MNPQKFTESPKISKAKKTFIYSLLIMVSAILGILFMPYFYKRFIDGQDAKVASSNIPFGYNFYAGTMLLFYLVCFGSLVFLACSSLSMFIERKKQNKKVN